MAQKRKIKASRMLHSCSVGLALLVLTVASPLLPIVLPPNASTAALPLVNTSAVTQETDLEEPTVQCNGDRYGHELNLQSCRELVEHQMVDSGQETFGPRLPSPLVPPGRTASYPTPWLFSSGKPKAPHIIWRWQKDHIMRFYEKAC